LKSDISGVKNLEGPYEDHAYMQETLLAIRTLSYIMSSAHKMMTFSEGMPLKDPFTHGMYPHFLQEVACLESSVERF